MLNEKVQNLQYSKHTFHFVQIYLSSPQERKKKIPYTAMVKYVMYLWPGTNPHRV